MGLGFRGLGGVEGLGSACLSTSDDRGEVLALPASKDFDPEKA